MVARKPLQGSRERGVNSSLQGLRVTAAVLNRRQDYLLTFDIPADPTRPPSSPATTGPLCYLHIEPVHLVVQTEGPGLAIKRLPSPGQII